MLRSILDSKIFIYLTKRIVLSFFAIFTILTFIIFGNQLFLVLNQSLKDGFLSSELLPYMSLKVLRDMPFIISLGFSLAITFSLNYLHKNSEMVILSNAGIGDKQTIRLLAPLIIFFGLIVFIFSFFIVPSAKKNIFEIRENAKSRPDYVFFKEGVFQNFQNGDLTFFSNKVSNTESDDGQLLEDIFIESKSSKRVIVSHFGRKFFDHNSGDVFLYLTDGNIFENFENINNEEFSVSNFDNLSIKIFDKKEKSNFYIEKKEEVFSISDLLNSNTKQSTVELLHRISIPLMLIIISILAIYVSKTTPRSRKNFSIGYTLIAFVGYYNVVMYFKAISESTDTVILFNFFLPHLLFVLFLFFIYFYQKTIFKH